MTTEVVARVLVAGGLAWAAVTALDARTVGLASAIEAIFLHRYDDAAVLAFAAEWSRLRFVDALALLPVCAVHFGGLPIALFALTADRIRRRPVGPRAVSFACYPCFVLQLVSMFVSAMWILLSLSFWSELEAGWALVVAYFGAQLAVGMWALPAWRRGFDRAATAQLHSYYFREAV